jgi:hypothetical protein
MVASSPGPTIVGLAVTSTVWFVDVGFCGVCTGLDTGQAVDESIEANQVETSWDDRKARDGELRPVRVGVPGLLDLARSDRRMGWGLNPKRSLWTALVESLDVDPQDLLQVPTAEDQQPDEAVAVDAPRPHRSA